MMQGEQAPFSQEAFDRSDEKCKGFAQWVFKLLYDIDAVVNTDKDRYAVDLLLYYNGRLIGYADAEEKRCLSNFNFDTLHVLERKKKYLDLDQPHMPVFLMYFSTDGDVCFMTRLGYCKDLKLAEVKNSRVPTGELFYKVPMRQVRVLDFRKI